MDTELESGVTFVLTGVRPQMADDDICVVAAFLYGSLKNYLIAILLDIFWLIIMFKTKNILLFSSDKLKYYLQNQVEKIFAIG